MRESQKIGAVALIEYAPDRWRIDYRDPHNNDERVRIRLKAATYPDAVADAEAHNRYYRGDVDIRPDKKRAVTIQRKHAARSAAALTVSDAVTGAEANLGYRENSLRNYRNDAACFERWLKETHDITRWIEVLPSHVVAYLQQMKAEKLSRNRARLCLLPIRITSEHWAAEHPEHYRDVYSAKRKEIRRLMKPDGWPAKTEAVALTTAQAHNFLDYLQHNHPTLHPMARMILATGLRVYECAWLRACDIDRKAMTVTPQDSEHHELKTGKSSQTVPVNQWALEAVPSWPIDETQPVFTSTKGRPWKPDNLGRTWWKACDEARTAGIVPADFTAKSLRATFATNLARLGISELMIQRAMRQAPDNVLSDAYTKISVADLQSIWATYGQTDLFKQAKSNKISTCN